MKPDPENIREILGYAREARQNGDLQTACWWAEQAVSLDPDSREAWLFLAALVGTHGSGKHLAWELKVNPRSQRARQEIFRALERMQVEQAAQPSTGERYVPPKHEENPEFGETFAPVPAQLAAVPIAPTAPGLGPLQPVSYPAGWPKILAGIPPGDLWISLAYLVAVTVAESMTVLSRLPQVGLALHGVLLTTIILHAALFAHGARQKLLITLALGPLIRLMSLTLPLQDFPLIYWYAMIGAPLFLAAFLVYRFVSSGPAKVRVNGRALPLQVLVGLTGLGLGYLEYRILKPAPLISSLTWERVLVPALILFFFTGMLEEIIFRGLIQRSATVSLGRYGLLYSALWFAVLHLGYRSISDVIFVFVVAIFFGIVVARTGSLFGVTMAHGLTNISLYLVIPFLIQTPSPTITAPWVNKIPTAQRIMIVTPTLTPTPTVPTPAVPTPSLTPTASLTATRYLPIPSLTPTSTFPSEAKAPTSLPPPTNTGFPQTPTPVPVPVSPVPQNTPVPVTPVPQETPFPSTPVPDTPVPPDTPIPPTANP